MIVEVVGAVILDPAGRLLTVRKRGTARFMLPGGKREAGEDDLAALARELDEELGVRIVAATLLGVFEATAANEVDTRVRSHAYRVQIEGEIVLGAEIDELLWLDPIGRHAAPIAPLLAQKIIPALALASEQGRAANR